MNIFKFLHNYLILSHQIELLMSCKTTFIKQNDFFWSGKFKKMPFLFGFVMLIICTLGSLPRLVKLWWMETPSPGSFFSSLILSQSGHIFFFLSSFCLSFRWNESIIYEPFFATVTFFLLFILTSTVQRYTDVFLSLDIQSPVLQLP